MRRWKASILAWAALLFGALQSASVLYAPAVGDEGYFLYSARLAASGLRPYRDFLFWQPPTVLYVYGLLGRLAGFRIQTQRWFSAALGLAGFVFAADVARRRGGRLAVAVFVALVGLNVAYAQEVSIVKTQSLAVCLCAAGLWVYEASAGASPRLILALLLLAAAAAARASFLAVLLSFWAFLAARERRRRRWVFAGIAASAAMLACGFLFFYALSGGRIVFGLVRYPSLAATAYPLLEPAYWRVLLGQQGAALAFFVAALIANGFDLQAFDWLLLASWASMTVLHFVGPLRYPHYQLANLPLLALFVSLSAARALKRRPSRARLAVLAALFAVALASIRWSNAAFVHQGSAGSLRRLDELAASLSPYISRDGFIYTTETGVAVDGGYRVLGGLHMGVYSNLDSCARLGRGSFSNGQCLDYGATNNELLIKSFEAAQPDVILLQPWDLLVLQGPDGSLARASAAIHRNYVRRAVWQGIGQNRATTAVWVRRASPR